MVMVFQNRCSHSVSSASSLVTASIGVKLKWPCSIPMLRTQYKSSSAAPLSLCTMSSGTVIPCTSTMPWAPWATCNGSELAVGVVGEGLGGWVAFGALAVG